MKMLKTIRTMALLSLCFSCISCIEKQAGKRSLLEDALFVFDGSAYTAPVCFFPLKFKCKDDSIVKLVYGEGLYNDLNMHFCGYDVFAKSLMSTIEKDGYLNVDSVYFASIRKDAIVIDDSVQSCYKKEGIDGIIKRYVSQQSYLTEATTERADYLIYLLYQHRISCRLLMDCTLAMYVDFSAADSAARYLEIISKNKRLEPILLK